MGKVKGIAGGAILGDGRVGLILDTVEIAALARQTVSELKDEEIGKELPQHNDKGITVYIIPFCLFFSFFSIYY